MLFRSIAVLTRYLYASPDYLKAAAPLTHPDDLTKHVLCIGEGATSQQEVRRTFYRGEEVVNVMIASRFRMNSVGLSRALAMLGVGIAVLDTELAREDVASGRLRRVLPDWCLKPVQVHAITDTRLLPARTRLFIDFIKARMS